MRTLFQNIAILGCPSNPHVPWTPENVQRVKRLGFTEMQLNIAWGARPADEPLTLEDVVDPTDDMKRLDPAHGGKLNSDPARRDERRADLKRRIALCKEAGLRTLYHFGCPNLWWYKADYDAYHGKMPRCISDGQTPDYYAATLKAFNDQFPGVDDVLVYTYDQDAWQCSEFGDCPNCRGTPLHQRLPAFVKRLAGEWRKYSPDGRLWWEPWELSAGQVYQCVEGMTGDDAIGLALHVNIAEVISTCPVDRWLKNTCNLAKQRRIPVIVEGFFGAPTEEVEPLQRLAHPLVPFRELKAIMPLPGVVGIKEYFGLVPDKEDPNLRMTAALLADPDITEEAALAKVAESYGPAAQEMTRFWTLTSEAQELFPWDTSWYLRCLGRSDIHHALSAAMIRGQQVSTPSWDSTRAAIFMKTDDRQPNPYMIEDVQLRFEMAIDRFKQALAVGEAVQERVPTGLRDDLRACLDDTREVLIRAIAYRLHLRETNLATVMRRYRSQGQPVAPRVLKDMEATLAEDLKNQGGDADVAMAMQLLRADVDQFLKTYFLEGPDKRSRGVFSLTSR